MKDKALKLVGERTQLIEALNKRLESVVGSSQSALMEMVLSDFVDKLETKDGKILNSAKNRRLVALLDTTFQQYGKDHGPAVVKTLVDGVQKVVNFNKKYFATFTTEAKLLPLQTQVKDSISSWLGVKDGSAARNGYLDTLIKADQVRQEVKDLAISHVVNQAGLTEARKAVKGMLQTDPINLGRLEKYYRNFTYDLYSQVDRTAAKIQADKLGLQYAIYEGGLIKTSRQFCKERNGKVFTSEEIAEFDPVEAKQPDYNAATDLGGYGCRHHLNYIPYAVAVALRPDLKNDNPKPPVKKDPPKPEDPKPEKVKIDPPVEPGRKTPFDKIQDHSYERFRPDNADQQRALDKFNGLSKKREDALTANEVLELEMDQARRKLWDLDRTSPEGIQAAAKLNEIQGQYGKAFQELSAVNEQMAVHEEAFKGALLNGRAQAEIKVKTSPTLAKSPTYKREADKAFDFLRKALKGWTDEIDFDFEVNMLGPKGRAKATEQGIYVRESGPARTIVHEFGHIIEFNHNKLKKAAVDFLERRTAGAKIVKLKKLFPHLKYRPDEVTKLGGFYSPYVGKQYKYNTPNNYNGFHATEVISMGLEYMFENPLTFLREDPDHFAFIYSLFFKK